jgi:hypothetical protein
VTGVHNHLQVALPDGDFRDNAKLTTAASNALAGNVTVPDTVKATAADGHVYLTGTVAYGTERAAAEAAVTGADRGPQRHRRHRDQLRDRPGRRRPARAAGAGALGTGPGR